MLRWIIGIYILILAILLGIFTAVSRHKKRFEVLFTYDVDYAFYETSRALLAAKDSLYDYDTTLKVMYHDKKKIFTKPAMTYQEQFPKIQENITYLENLLQKKIFTENFHQKLIQNYYILQKIETIRTLIHTILTF